MLPHSRHYRAIFPMPDMDTPSYDHRSRLQYCFKNKTTERGHLITKSTDITLFCQLNNLILVFSMIQSYLHQPGTG